MMLLECVCVDIPNRHIAVINELKCFIGIFMMCTHVIKFVTPSTGWQRVGGTRFCTL